MKLKMAQNSLFAILLRSPWWISVVVAGAAFAGLSLVLPAVYAAFCALPFAVIALYAGWQQLRTPSVESVARKLDKLRGSSWDEFSGAVEAAFRRDGYAVSRLAGEEADFELSKSGRVALLSCKRWKAARTGVEPLRQLHAARRKRDAQECIYVAAGEISDNARAFSAQHNIRLLQAAELASLLRR
jgi:restriction system protein